MVTFESLGTVSYSSSIVTMAVSVAVCEIFSVKASKQASLFAQLINKDIISMNNVQGQAARKAHKAQHCWPPCKINN